MFLDQFSQHYPTLWVYAIIPALICLARILDVSIGTMRIVFLSRGMKGIAPVLGFFEVIIWLLAIGQVMKHMDSWINYIAYGIGFALGNYLGMVLEEKLSVGHVMLRIITRLPAMKLVNHFRNAGYRMTYVDGEGLKGPVQIMFTIAKRKQLAELLDAVREFNPAAVYSIEDVRTLSPSAVQPVGMPATPVRKRLFRFHRKGK